MSPLAGLARSLLNSVPLYHHGQMMVRRMMEVAQRDADEIVQAAEERRAEIIEQFRKEGYEAGFAAGREEGRASLNEQHHLLEQAVHALESAKVELLNAHREDMVALAAALTGRMLRHVGGPDAQTARQLLTEMLPRTTGNRSVVVKLAPEDLDVLQHELDALAAFVDAETTVEFIADDRLPTGNVLVETERGALDGTESARARRLAEHLLGVMEYED